MMKALLLAVLVLLVPAAADTYGFHTDLATKGYANEAATQWMKFENIFGDWLLKVRQDLESLYQNLQSQNPDSDVINQQFRQLLNDTNQLNQQIMNQTALNRLQIKRLPSIVGDHSKRGITVDGIRLEAGDNGVSSAVLKTGQATLHSISLPILKKNLNRLPDNQTQIVLFSSARTYADSLSKAGVPEQQISSIVSETGGVAVGSQVWIPLYNLHEKADLANVLTHELTHAIFNQEGIGEQLPTWVNEGMAWHDGMTALTQVNPNLAKRLSQAENAQIDLVKKQGHLLPLTANEQDILDAKYNVEWVDYQAVEHLMQQYGEAKFASFLNDIPRMGVNSSFHAIYPFTIQSYEAAYTK